METVSPALQDDSSGANPSSIKSDDSSPRPESGRGSPPPNCAICLGTCRNKSFTDSCLHQFCFKCLLTWSKVKAECPLCKQNFRSIIHNVRSNHQYEEYMVEQSQVDETVDGVDFDNIVTAARRFRYRTTLTLPRRESLAIQQLLLHYPLMADMFGGGGAAAGTAPPLASRPPVARRRRSPASFRRTVYRHNLWARPLPDFTGRFRDCSPEFYRYNNTQMHRLVPWLNRELHYLLNENIGHISYVMARILELLPQHHINSLEFREGMQRYFGDRTEHFLHELYCFASTPYDMTGYDRNVQYTTDTRISTMINEVISSTDSEASVDSDIVMVSSSQPAEPPPGPSRQPAPVYPHNYIPQPNTGNVIPIETISQSDSDDDSSEVMVVGYIKPPQERTPEIVDLLGSDSDVILQDNVQPETSQNADSTESRPIPLVKLSLKRHIVRAEGDSDSDDSTYRPPVSRRKRRHRSNETATTSDTRRTTPSHSPSATPSPSPSATPSSSPSIGPASTSTSTSTSTTTLPSPPAADSQPTTPASATTSASTSASTSALPFADDLQSNDGTDSSNRSYSSNHKKSKVAKRKTKKKTKEGKNHSKDKKKNKKSSTHHSRKDDRKKTDEGQSERDKQSKRKSHLGKGVKSSRRSEETRGVAAQPPPVPTPSPTPAPALAQPGPSGSSTRRHKLSKERKRHRSTHESKRLRSVVNVMYSHKNTGESSSSGTSNTHNDEAVDDKTRKVRDDKGNSASSDDERTLMRGRPDSSDSEDDLPLNLTVKKSQALTCL